MAAEQRRRRRRGRGRGRRRGAADGENSEKQAAKGAESNKPNSGKAAANTKSANSDAGAQPQSPQQGGKGQGRGGAGQKRGSGGRRRSRKGRGQGRKQNQQQKQGARRQPAPDRASEAPAATATAAKAPAVRTAPPPRVELTSLDQMSDRIRAVLQQSPADETEIVWIEQRRGEAESRGPRVDARSSVHRTILTRVIDHGRVGSHRGSSQLPGELADDIRQAIAHSRINAPLPGLPHIPKDEATCAPMEDTFCPRTAELSKNKARKVLEDVRQKREALNFDWTHARVAVFNSRGTQRTAEVTSSALQIAVSRQAGAGRAATASRLLANLNGEALQETAQRRHAEGSPVELPAGPFTVVLSPEAMIELVALLNRTSFTASSYSDGTSFLREHLGVQVFDRGVTLRDDATDPSGLPFPFDLEGTAKRSVDLILKGTPKTPALDQRQAAQLGLQPTAHSISGNDARAENLILAAGEMSTDELVAEAGDGVWIGWLDGVAPIDPKRVRFLAHARSLRRIRDGVLAEALPDSIWDDSLLRCLSESPRFGSETTRRLSRDGTLGGLCAPSGALSGVTLARAPGFAG